MNDLSVLTSGLNLNLVAAVFLILATLFENYLKIRQFHKLKRKEDISHELSELNLKFKPETLEKTRKYNMERTGFAMISSYYSLFTVLFKLYTLSLGETYNWLFYKLDSHLLTLIVYSLFWGVVDTLIDLPFSYYNTFGIEQKFGFNKMTIKMFVKDTLKNVVLGLVIGCLMMAILDWILVNLKQYFIVAAWLFFVAFLIIYIIIMPKFILPLYYKLTSLDQENEKEKLILEQLKTLSEKTGFPLGDIFKMDGSTKSAHSQAFFIGVFGNRTVVLYDTLIDQLEVDEIMGVLCHEIGHWKYSHNYRNIGSTVTLLFAVLYSFSFLIDNPRLYFDFGLEMKVYWLGFSFSLMLFKPLFMAFGAAMCALVRKCEYEADQYAFEMGRCDELKRGLIKISKENNVDLSPDPVYSMFTHSHPTILNRLRALNMLMAKKK